MVGDKVKGLESGAETSDQAFRRTDVARPGAAAPGEIRGRQTFDAARRWGAAPRH